MFQHQRHKQPQQLDRPRELVVMCMPLRSNINLSRILRTTSCFGISRLIACGRPKIDSKISRDATSQIEVELHRSLLPVLEKMKLDQFQLVGLEQTTGSQSLYSFAFSRRTALVIGNERVGLPDEVLRLLDHVVEIPMYGLPHSLNVATATDMAIYEYCRQFPRG